MFFKHGIVFDKESNVPNSRPSQPEGSIWVGSIYRVRRQGEESHILESPCAGDNTNCLVYFGSLKLQPIPVNDVMSKRGH